jgi:hypothetical protein
MVQTLCFPFKGADTAVGHRTTQSHLVDFNNKEQNDVVSQTR